MRSQFWRSQLLLPALLFLALILFLVPEAEVNSLRGRALSALSPVLGMFSGFHHAPPGEALIRLSVETPKASQPAKPEVAPEDFDKLNKENDELRAALVRLQTEINRLKTALPGDTQPVQTPPSISANVIQRQVLWQEPLYGLDHGESEGVRLHAGVLHRGAVVGRIVAVGPHASSLALLTHRGMCITARLVECRVEGVLQGAKDDGGERLCRLIVPGRECSAKIGEHVVTSGYDGAFPPGLWLGEVTAIKRSGDLQWELSVRPACSENAIEMVRVLTGKLPEVPWPAMPKTRK